MFLGNIIFDPFPSSVYFGEVSKPFGLDIADSRNTGSILNYGGYELMKEIAGKRGKSLNELLKEVLENIGKGEKGAGK